MPGRQPSNTFRSVVPTLGLMLLFSAASIASHRVNLTAGALSDGLAMFAIFGAVALVGGWAEGFAKNARGWIAVRWLLIGAAGGIAGALYQWSFPGSDWSGFAQDLIVFVPVPALLCAGLATIGSLVGTYVADHRPLSH